MSDSFDSDELVFCGKFEHSIDSQGRIAIPKDWRYKDKESRYILLPSKNFLQLYPFESFKNFLAKAKEVSFADRKKAMALAKVASKAQECRCDKQGRIKIPSRLLATADLNGQATLVGAFTSAQIWSPTNWEIELENEDDEEYLNEIMNIG